MYIPGAMHPILANLDNQTPVFKEPNIGFVFYVPREQLMGQATGLAGRTLDEIQLMLSNLTGQMTPTQREDFIMGAMLNYTAGHYLEVKR